MLISEIIQILQRELKKTKEKGLWVLIGWSVYFLYLYLFPKLLFSLYPSFPYTNLFLTYTIGTYSIQLFAFISINIVYLSIYKLKHPFFEAYKSNPGPWPWESPNFPETLKKLFKSVLINQFLVMPFALLVFGLMAKYDNSLRCPGPLEVISQVLFFSVIEDFTFYWTHRLLHQGSLYRMIHKQHHEFTVVFSMVAQYAHPLEYLFGNILPVGMGPLLYGESNVHLITAFTWAFLRPLYSVEEHSGYSFPWSPLSSTTEMHDYHHFKNQGNYASHFPFWDVVFGTSTAYLKYEEKNEKKVK